MLLSPWPNQIHICRYHIASPTTDHRRTAPLLVAVAGHTAPYGAEAQQEVEVPYSTSMPLYIGTKKKKKKLVGGVLWHECDL